MIFQNGKLQDMLSADEIYHLKLHAGMVGRVGRVGLALPVDPAVAHARNSLKMVQM